MDLRRSLQPLWLLIGYLVLGSLAIARHVLLGLALRPDWSRLSDNRCALLWFGSACIGASCLRWVALGEVGLFQVVYHVLVYMALLVYFLERKHQSSAIVFMCWAVSTGVDLLASGLLLVGAAANTGRLQLVLFALEMTWLALTVRSFHRQPESIRRRGYRRDGGPSFVADTQGKQT